MDNIVYVAVFTRQDRVFDDTERSYLPLFYSVLGVYKDFESAFTAACEVVYGDKMSEVDSCYSFNDRGETIGHSWTFRYDYDKYGGYALYELEISKEYITESNEKI